MLPRRSAPSTRGAYRDSPSTVRPETTAPETSRMTWWLASLWTGLVKVIHATACTISIKRSRTALFGCRHVLSRVFLICEVCRVRERDPHRALCHVPSVEGVLIEQGHVDHWAVTVSRKAAQKFLANKKSEQTYVCNTPKARHRSLVYGRQTPTYTPTVTLAPFLLRTYALSHQTRTKEL